MTQKKDSGFAVAENLKDMGKALTVLNVICLVLAIFAAIVLLIILLANEIYEFWYIPLIIGVGAGIEFMIASIVAQVLFGLAELVEAAAIFKEKQYIAPPEATEQPKDNLTIKNTEAPRPGVVEIPAEELEYTACPNCNTRFAYKKTNTPVCPFCGKTV